MMRVANLFGFGAVDFAVLGCVLLLTAVALTCPFAGLPLRRLARNTAGSMAVLAAIPVVMRLFLLPHCPVPLPSGADDFSYVLLGDTLAHFRFANPVHSMHRFFEGVFALQEPSYSSIYPLGQGIALAAGKILFGHFWAGVLACSALLCALTDWMLRAWTTPMWAFAGGLVAVMQFGPLSQWTNTYWGGAVSAIAGCLIFGALPRMSEKRIRNGVLAGTGLGLQLLTRPFEAVLLMICVALFFAFDVATRGGWRKSIESLALIGAVCLPAIALTALQNKAVTGNWTTLPYALSRYQYGVPATFTFQPNAKPHRELTPEQELDYRAQAAIHGDGQDSLAKFSGRLLFRLRYYRFFFLPAMCLAILAFVTSWREPRFAWVAAALLTFACGTNFYPYFHPHYVAAIACLLILVSVEGLRRMGSWTIRGHAAGRAMSRIVLAACAVQFLFWYCLHLAGPEEIWPAMRYETSDFVNYGDPEGRIAIDSQLKAAAGRQLVFVRYGAGHRFHEWIHNEADIDAAKVVWARDLGQEENDRLIHYYPNRKVWLAEPDAWPPKLMPLENATFMDAQ